MTDFASILQQGSGWLFVPSAILLGALHGLEPGHSKTMMAAFIVAIRGTLAQAVLLGLSATVSHTAVVWAVAMAGLYFGQNWNAGETEPYFQVGSALLIIGVAAWMLWRTRQDQQRIHDHDHDHEHGHGHHHDESKRIDTGHGVVRLEIFEDRLLSRFRLRRVGQRGYDWAAGDVQVRTERANGQHDSFTFVRRAGFLESIQQIPEPHEFVARLSLAHGGHRHDYTVEYVEHDHGHGHEAGDGQGLDVSASGYQDPHELAHANDIRRRFANQSVTTGQIIVFGLTGGLIPCPASITVLLLCLQLKRIALGASLVLCFSIGLAMTMVASGALAALSVKQVEKRWGGFGDFARKAPYLSSALILVVGLYTGYQGLIALK